MGSKRHKTPADAEERVVAAYSTTLSYAETARRTGIPRTTCVDIVKRRAGDGIEELRQALRSDLAETAFAKAATLVDLVTPENLGTERSSKGSEAARAAHDIARVAVMLSQQARRPEENAAPPPVNVKVFTGCAPPPEIGESEEERPEGVPPRGIA